MARPARAGKSGGEVRHYFVDEGGDSTLFAGKGQVIVGTPGCSRFFMLGLLDVADPAGLAQALLAGEHFQNYPDFEFRGVCSSWLDHLDSFSGSYYSLSYVSSFWGPLQGIMNGLAEGGCCSRYQTGYNDLKQ